MSLLLIDIGNTAIHWGVMQGDRALTPMQSCVYRDNNIETLLSRHWSELPPIKTVFISSVATEETNVTVQQWLQQYWQITPTFIRAEDSGYGIQSAYVEPQQLGADRWAAMVAAYGMSQKACCTLDCGTAVTFDVIDANGLHLGGWIMPGYRLFQQCLSQETAGIGMGGGNPVSGQVLGRSTQDGINIAWHQGISSLVQRSLAGSGLLGIDCYITGGDAPRMLPLLDDGWCYANDLVLQGLAIMATHE